MHEGVILPAVGHLPVSSQWARLRIPPIGKMPVAASASLTLANSRQIGLLAEVVGTFGDKMRHGALRLRWQRNTALTAGTGAGE